MSSKDDATGAIRLEIILHFPNGGRLSPEHLRVIEAIRRQRSILAAGRTTGISYRICWLLVDALNRTFDTPVFVTFRADAAAEPN